MSTDSVVRIIPLESWTCGDTLDDVFMNMLNGLLWASNPETFTDCAYGSFSFKPSTVLAARDTLVAFRINRIDKSIKIIVDTAGCGPTDFRRRLSGVLKTHIDGSVSGSATLTYGIDGPVMFNFGLREVDGVLTWRKTGQYVYHNFNDIEMNQMPLNKEQLVQAIRHHFINMAIRVIGEIDVPFDYESRLIRIVYQSSKESQRFMKLPLTPVDKAVFGVLARDAAAKRDIVIDPGVMDKNEYYFNRAVVRIESYYNTANSLTPTG